MIREYFGDGGKWGVTIHYIHEETPLGTAGALGLLPKDLPDLPMLMMNSDLLTAVNYLDLLRFHQEQNGLASACVREYDFQVTYEVIEREGYRIKSIREKPIHKFFVNAGIYVLEPALVKKVDGKDYLDMPALLEQCIEAGDQVNMFPVHEYWLDMGRVKDYERAQSEIDGLIRL